MDYLPPLQQCLPLCDVRRFVLLRFDGFRTRLGEAELKEESCCRCLPVILDAAAGFEVLSSAVSWPVFLSICLDSVAKANEISCKVAVAGVWHCSAPRSSRPTSLVSWADGPRALSLVLADGGNTPPALSLPFLP